MTDGTTNSVDHILFTTADPSITIDGRAVPALTSLLNRVCDNDVKKFEEVIRIVTLFVRKALEGR